MTRNSEGTWSYKRGGVQITSSSLDDIILALTELSIKPRAQKEVERYEDEMRSCEGGSDEWIAAKIRRDVWAEVAHA